jgi:D-alanyl-lipoteichoic acid acyltransferase DltB (MBOAT superfamily)
MTLSRFLRDYLYIALGGNRKGRAGRYRNLLVTMVLGGLWHGANWTFVAWGTLHGLFLVVNHFWRYLVRGRCDDSTLYRGAAWSITLFAVVNAWVMFRANSWQQAVRFYQEMYFAPPGLAEQQPLLAAGQVVPLLAGALFAALAMPNSQEIAGLQPGGSDVRLPRVRWRPTPAWGGLLALLLVCCALKLHSFSAFLYFQF